MDVEALHGNSSSGHRFLTGNTGRPAGWPRCFNSAIRAAETSIGGAGKPLVDRAQEPAGAAMLEGKPLPALRRVHALAGRPHRPVTQGSLIDLYAADHTD
jgi:hypothetical protein